MKRTFYEILGVPHDADQAVLDTAYAAAQAKVQEAIKLGTAEASMEAQLVKDGYQMLSDPAKRARYDAKLAADEKGVKLMFFTDDKNAQRKLGIQTFIFALLASTLVIVVFWQMNRKINEVRADYDTVVTRKNIEKNGPKVIEEVPVEQSGTKAAEATKVDTNAPRVSDLAKGETVLKLTDVVKGDPVAKDAPPAKR